MEKKVLIIDDEMYPKGSKDRKYGSFSESDLSIQMVKKFHNLDISVEFAQTGEQGIEIIESDTKKLFKCVLIDITFEGVLTSMQGADIYDEIMIMRPDLVIGIITKEVQRKITGKEDMFNQFKNKTDLFIPKKNFIKYGEELVSFINKTIEKEDVEYILKYYSDKDSKRNEFLILDILREEKGNLVSILSKTVKVTYPFSKYILDCIDYYPNITDWKMNALLKEEMLPHEFADKKYKLNNVIAQRSFGRITEFLVSEGDAGCKIGISKIFGEN